jgi:hypothetical protein
VRAALSRNSRSRPSPRRGGDPPVPADGIPSASLTGLTREGRKPVRDATYVGFL